MKKQNNPSNSHDKRRMHLASIVHTRPEPKHTRAARSEYYNCNDEAKLLNKKIDLGTNEYGYNFYATFKRIQGRLCAVLTPGIITHDESRKSFEFGAQTHLRTHIWL